jgi:hypothetical protein
LPAPNGPGIPLSNLSMVTTGETARYYRWFRRIIEPSHDKRILSRTRRQA